MHVLFIGDIHLGLRGASPVFEEEFLRFRSFLFRHVKEDRPAAIVHLGDLFDDRVKINVRTLNLAKSFLDEIRETGIPFFTILGNHDVHYRDTVRPNSVEPITREYPTIKVIHEPTDLKVGDSRFLLVPWICRTNELSVMEAIEHTDAQYLVGHFDMPGFEMSPGVLSRHGVDPERLERFRLVVSGHYHTWSKRGNVLYAGSPYQMTRSDDGQLKRLWKIDCENGELQAVVNDSVLFKTIRVSGEKIDGESFENWATESDFSGKIVTVVATDDAEDEFLEKIVRRLESDGANDVKVVDTRTNVDDLDGCDAATAEAIQTAGTLELILAHVDKDPDLKELDRTRLKSIMSSIYAEALGSSGDER